MKRVRLIFAAAVVAAMAACGQDDSGNVMAPSGNSLTPAQVDAALGPEIVETDANALTGNGTANIAGDMNEAGANEVSDSAPEQ